MELGRWQAGQARLAGVIRLGVCLSVALTLGTASASAAERLASCAAAPLLRAEVEQRWLPFWLRTVDPVVGGYVVSAPAGGPPDGARQLVAQARLVWGFAHAARAGFAPGAAVYLDAAGAGYRYLKAHHLDPRSGGYYWSTTSAGHALDTRKILYGQAFVIYAFVEYARASGDAAALADARALFAVLDAHARDRVHGGWLEHFEADWRPILEHRYLHVEVAGYKSANTHLHMMEALAELAADSRDRSVRAALADTLYITSTRFFPAPDATVTMLTPEWGSQHDSWAPATLARWVRARARGPLVSYGHNVEFAWLARRADDVLGRPVNRERFDRFLAHTLTRGVDPQQGGVYEFGYGDAPAHALDRVWWPQAEWLAGLTMALRDGPSPRYDAARTRLLDWTAAHQADPATGLWRERIHADGQAEPGPLAHDWKVNYHDLRAVTAYLQSCGALPGQ